MTLREVREKFEAKQKAVSDFYNSFKNDKGEFDIPKEKIEEGQALNAELKSLHTEYKKLQQIEDERQALTEAVERGAKRIGFSSGEEMKSFGEKLYDTSEFKNNALSKGRVEIAGSAKDYLLGMKTTMSTSAGFSNPDNRLPDVVPYAARTPIIQSIIPSIDVDVDVVKYMEKTTQTNNAAETTEGSALGENAYVWTQRTQAIETIGAFIPVTEQQMQVKELMLSVINDDLRLDLLRREEYQILNGDGVTPNILGIYAKPGILTQAKGGDPTPTAAFYLLTKLRHTGFVNPDAFIFHPNDWQSVRMLQSSTGEYIWGSPSDAGVDRLWGLPVIVSTAATEGTAVAGDFGGYARIYRRQNIVIEWGYNSDDFSKYKRTVRATERMCLVIRRAGAFGTLTGI